MAKKTLLDDIIESIKGIDGRLVNQSGTTKQMIADLNYKVVAPAKSAADSAVSAADAAVASAQVTSDTVSAIASAQAEAMQGANEAMSRALSAWDVATGAKSAVTDFDPLLKSAQSDAGKALTQIADTANALSDAKTAFNSGVAEAKQLASTAQTTADSAVESAGENAKALASQANALSDARKAMDSGVASATGLANAAQTTADNAVKSASSVANDLAAVASQAKSNASGITKVTSDVGLLQTTVADNSGNISKIQETAAQIQQAVSDNAGNITVAKQTADSAVAVASDAKSNATVAVQTASGASVTAKNAQGDATTAMVTAESAVTQASDAKSNATIAVQTASEASVTATNAQGDASVAKQTASDASVQIKNAQGDISKLQTRAGTIEASVATNSGAIADVQATANQLKASVSDNAGNITVAKQTADSAVAVASDARSNATVAIQTASQASITASNASGQAASAVLTANGALTTASNAKSDATVAVQTASGASLTATNAQSDATIAKQTASEATIQASNAESDFAQLSIRANKIEANVATNSGAIASVQQTASGLTTTVANIKSNGGGVNLVGNSETEFSGKAYWLYSGYKLASLTALTPGKTYTMSFSAKVDDKAVNCNQHIFVDIFNPSWSWATVANVPISTDYQRVTYTFTVPTNVTDASKITAYLSHPYINGKQDSSYDQSDVAGTGYIKKFMLEEGIIAHPWSPAPEDLQNQFTQIKTSINGVTTTINDPKTGLNATYQTVAGNASTISNVKGDVAQLQTTANGLTSRVGNLESKTDKQQTAIEQNKTAIALKADQTTVDTLKGTVNQNTATLKTQANQIQAKVSASDVTGMLTGYATQSYTQSLVTQTAKNWNLNLTSLQTDVNAIKTTGGGVNLLTGTSGELQTKQFTNAYNSGPQATNGNYKIKLVKGQTYTYRVWLDNTNGSAPAYVNVRFTPIGGTNFSLGNGTHIDNGKTGYSTLSITPSADGYAMFTPFAYTTRQTCLAGWKEEMLEEGTVAHTWSPAPSDLASVTSVTHLSATVDGIQSQVYNADGSSRITQLSGLIQSKVGTADFNNLKQSVGLQTLESADINNMKTTGHYFVHNLANNPIGGWVYVDVTGNGSDRIRQDVYQDIGNQHKYRRWVDTHWTDWEEGATYSEINQLKDDINLRVKQGDLLSQINIQAGTTLIQSNKLALDAATTVFTGSAFIPNAAISEIDTDKLYFSDSNGNKSFMSTNLGALDPVAPANTLSIRYKTGYEVTTSDRGVFFMMGPNYTRYAVRSKYSDNFSGIWEKDTEAFFIEEGYGLHLWALGKDQSSWGVFNSNNIGIRASLTGPNSIEMGKVGDSYAYNSGMDTGPTAIKVAINGWEWVSGYVEAMGHSQHSVLSAKTRIEQANPDHMLDLVNNTELTTFAYKAELADGTDYRHIGPIIDDVNDVAQYQIPSEFVAPTKTARDDGNIVGALIGAVQALTKRIKKLEEKA